MPQPLYCSSLLHQDPQHPLNRKLVGPQSWSGHSGGKKKPSPCRDSKPRFASA